MWLIWEATRQEIHHGSRTQTLHASMSWRSCFRSQAEISFGKAVQFCQELKGLRRLGESSLITFNHVPVLGTWGATVYTSFFSTLLVGVAVESFKAELADWRTCSHSRYANPLLKVWSLRYNHLWKLSPSSGFASAHLSVVKVRINNPDVWTTATLSAGLSAHVTHCKSFLDNGVLNSYRLA